MFRRTVKILAIAALTGCFLLPVQDFVESHRLIRCLEDFLHVPLFFGLFWLASSLAPAGNRPIMLCVIVCLVLAGGVELVQPYVGRERDLADLGYGAIGIVLGVFYYGLKIARGRTRLIWGGLMVLLLLLAALPLGFAGWDHYSIQNNYPEVASFESFWEFGRWQKNSCEVVRTRERSTNGDYGLKMTPCAGAMYPGLFLVDFVHDWSGIKAFCADVFLEEGGDAVLWVRVDDSKHPAAFKDRFQKPFVLRSGWNSICVQRSELAFTSGGRMMNLREIELAGFFLDSRSQDRVIILDSVRVSIE